MFGQFYTIRVSFPLGCRRINVASLTKYRDKLSAILQDLIGIEYRGSWSIDIHRVAFDGGAGSGYHFHIMLSRIVFDKLRLDTDFGVWKSLPEGSKPGKAPYFMCLLEKTRAEIRDFIDAAWRRALDKNIHRDKNEELVYVGIKIPFGEEGGCIPEMYEDHSWEPFLIQGTTDMNNASVYNRNGASHALKNFASYRLEDNDILLESRCGTVLRLSLIDFMRCLLHVNTAVGVPSKITGAASGRGRLGELMRYASRLSVKETPFLKLGIKDLAECFKVELAEPFRLSDKERVAAKVERFVNARLDEKRVIDDYIREHYPVKNLLIEVRIPNDAKGHDIALMGRIFGSVMAKRKAPKNTLSRAPIYWEFVIPVRGASVELGEMYLEKVKRGWSTLRKKIGSLVKKVRCTVDIVDKVDYTGFKRLSAPGKKPGVIRRDFKTRRSHLNANRTPQ